MHGFKKLVKDSPMSFNSPTEKNGDFENKKVVIRAFNISKTYQIYDRPQDRLKQFFSSRIAALSGKKQVTLHREFHALNNISFEVVEGETVGIIGTNGSGKSTLLQILCGTLNPSHGEVKVVGRVAALLELGAGFNPEFTGRENVYLNATVLGMTEKEIDESFSQIEEFAEIGDFIDQPVKTYSSGMYVRLAFSVAIHTKPSILIVDEALSVGDARFQAKCLNRIKKMKMQGVSILFVSHDIGAVRSLCDRAIWLDRGVIRQSGLVFPLTAQYTEFMFAETIDTDTAADQVAVNNAEEEPIQPLPVHDKNKPINHWGTHIGTVISAGIFDGEGQRKSIFTNRELIFVKIRFKLIPDIDLSKLSVSFSLKNVAGEDLIVGSSWANKCIEFSDAASHCEVQFILENCLNDGDYLLVAAIEERSGATIQYYEYVEGAQYFSTAFDGDYHGKFLPKINMSINYLQGNLK